jgi:hypothetical protein
MGSISSAASIGNRESYIKQKLFAENYGNSRIVFNLG